MTTHSVGPTVLLVVSDFLDIFDVEILTNDVYVKVQKKFEMTFHNCILQCTIRATSLSRDLSLGKKLQKQHLTKRY